MLQILIIDEQEETRFSLRKFLEIQGLKVVDAPDGETALMLFSVAPADVVILDIIMPQGEGLSTVAGLRRISPAVKILAIPQGGDVEAEKYRYIADSFGVDRTLTSEAGKTEILEAVRELLPAGREKG